MRRLLLLTLVGAILLNTIPVLADDGFYLVAVGVGVGTKITSVPYTVSTPGFYYLSGNLTAPGRDNVKTFEYFVQGGASRVTRWKLTQ